MAPASNKVKMKVTEMRDANVQFISLVTRSANRIPFRIKKSEEESQMGLNLTSIARVLKGAKEPEAVTNKIVGVATMAQEGEKLEAVKKSLEDHGFKVDDMEAFEDGSLVFKQDDYEGFEGEPSLVRLSDNMVLVVKGFAPYDNDVEGDFLTNVKAKGFYSGLDTATSAFRETLYQLLRESKDQPEAVTAVQDLLGQFSTYVGGLVRAIPTKAFKAEMELGEAVAAVKEEPAAEPAAEAAETEAAPAADDAKEPEAKVADPAPAGEEATSGEEAKPAPAETVAKADDKVLEQLTNLTKIVEGLSTAIKGISEEQAEIKQNVDESARKAEAASKAVKGVIVAAPEDEQTRSGNPETAVKADTDPRTGCFDTAFLRKN